MATGAGVDEAAGAVGGTGGLLNVFSGAIATKNQVAGLEVVEDGLVDRIAFGLVVGTGGAADVGAFVPGEAEPAQVVEDFVGAAGLYARQVEVFHAEDELAVLEADLKPGQESGAEIAQVERSGGAGGVASANRVTAKMLAAVEEFLEIDHGCGSYCL